MKIDRKLTKDQWKAARLCRKGEVAHGPVNLLAKLWKQGKFHEQ